MDTTTSSIIAIVIAVISAVVAIWTIIKLYLKAKHPQNVTIIKRNTGERITVSTNYNKEDSKRLLEFMK